MTVKEILSKTGTTFSFEFFPPRTEESWGKLFNSIADLKSLKPSFVSVTYGAGGSTRENTHNLVVKIKKETELNVVSHLTCVAHTRDEIYDILKRYNDNGIKNILALKGDPQPGMEQFMENPDGFNQAADLVKFIKKHFPDMCVGVAGFPEGHPSTRNRLLEIEYLKAKVNAGADYIITQLFFDNRDYYDFCERCEFAGIHVPIIAGIMPIITLKGMIRTAEIAAGARIPASLLKAVARAQSDEFVENIGIHWATEQIRDLLDNKVKGIHLYTLNHSKASLKIYDSLGVSNSLELTK